MKVKLASLIITIIITIYLVAKIEDAIVEKEFSTSSFDASR